MLFTNNAATTLNSSITNVATSLTVATGTGALFPTLSAGQYFYVTLANNAGTVEIVKCTARTTDTFTIVRAQDGTAAVAWNAGDKVELRLVRADLLNFGQLDSTNTWALGQTFSSAVTLSGGLSAALPVASGGTNNGSLGVTAGGVYYGDGTKVVETAAGTAGQVLVSNGASAPTWGAGSRSGLTTFNLSSGTPNGTLTSASNQLVVVSATSPNCSVTMPNMTTVTSVGVGYFRIYNTSAYSIAIKDSGSVIREVIPPNTSAILNLRDNSTATGIWEFTDAPIAMTVSNVSLDVGGSGLANPIISSIIPVTATQFVYVYCNAAYAATIFAKLGTITPSTGSLSFGSAITLYTLPTNVGANRITGTSDRVDRGCIVIGESTGGATAGSLKYYGFAIVSNALYISTQNVGITTTSTASQQLSPKQCDYLGANNSFFIGTSYYFTTSGTSSGLDFRQFTVTVAGTVVTVTNATGNGSVTISTTTTNSRGFFGRTGTTSYIYDQFVGTSTFNSGGYVSCNTATNTLTKGARTTQNTSMTENLVQSLIGYCSTNHHVNSSTPFVINSAGTRVFNYGYCSAITNAGSATVTVALATDITIKSAASSTYRTISSTEYPLPYCNSAASYNGNNSFVTTTSGFSVSSSDYIVIGFESSYSENSGQYYSIDPTASTFNINTGSTRALFSGPGIPVFFTSTSALYYNSDQKYVFEPVALPTQV